MSVRFESTRRDAIAAVNDLVVLAVQKRVWGVTGSFCGRLE